MRIFTREAGFNARELTDKGGRGLLLSGPCSQSWECSFVSSARLLLRSSLLVHCSQSFVHWNCFPGIATLWYCMMLCDVQLQVPLWVSQTAPGEIGGNSGVLHFPFPVTFSILQIFCQPLSLFKPAEEQNNLGVSSKSNLNSNNHITFDRYCLNFLQRLGRSHSWVNVHSLRPRCLLIKDARLCFPCNGK